MTHDPAPAAPRGTRAPASRQVLNAASVAVLVTGLLAAVTVSIVRADLPDAGDWWVVLGLALILVGLNVRPRRTLVVHSNLETINLDEILFVPLLVMVVPWQTFTIVGAASLVASLVVRRSFAKTAFNLGQILIAASAGALVVAIARVEPSENPHFTSVLAGMAGAFIMTAVTALAVRSVVSLATGAELPALVRDISGRFLPWIGAVMLGGLATVAVGSEPATAILAIGVAAFVHRAYAATFRELAARHEAERLQETVVSLRSQTNPDDIERDLRLATMALLGATAADIVPAGESSGFGALSAPLDRHRALRVDQRQGPGSWTDDERAVLVTLAGVAGDVLRSAETIARLRTITDSQSEGIIALDLQCAITFANPAARLMLGLDPAREELDGSIDARIGLQSRRRPIDIAGMVTRRIVNREADATLTVDGRDELDVSYSITPLYADTAHVGAVLVLRDVSERRIFRDELERRDLHDELTGLPNRRLLLDRLDQALARSRRTGSQHGLIFCDLDRFKLVNDSYGHLVGDKLLLQVAERLRENLSAADSLARLSGDEFVVLLEDANTVENVVAVAERLLEVLRLPYELDGQAVFISASMGVVLSAAGQERTHVLSAAGAAAYAAKLAGRDRYRVSTNDSVAIARTRLELETRLRHGLDNGEFQVHYQPIVRTGRGEIYGAEALVRWEMPGRGMVVPSDFIPLAEETRLIVPLGRWVLEESCRQVQEWTVRHPDRPPLSISVNLSGVQFTDQPLVKEVAATLERTGLAASQLCLEITETVLMDDTGTTVATLEALRDLGVRVAIDDFGTGYSSLSYLRRFPVDVVKVDQSFVGGLDVDHVDTEIVSAVIGLATVLGIATVAEGVETDGQRAMLEEMGCPYMQGYLAARPLRADAFESYWSERAAQEPPGEMVKMPAPRRKPDPPTPPDEPRSDHQHGARAARPDVAAVGALRSGGHSPGLRGSIDPGLDS